MTRPLIHPRLLGSVGDQRYPSAASLFIVIDGRDAYGQPTNQEEIPVVGVDVSAIECRIAPVSASEPRSADQTISIATHRVALRGSYPQIEATWRVHIDGVGYNILSVDHDGNHQSTYLNVELVQ